MASTYQSRHNGWKTAALELPPSQVPRFGEQTKFIFKTPIPAEGSTLSGPEVSINETSDVKLQFSFGNSLLAPWVPIYDSKKREVIESLIITFYTDKYNLVRVAQEYVFKDATTIASINHPSVTAVEITYRWRGAEDQDNPYGIFVMFISAVVACVVLLVLLARADGEPSPRGSGGGAAKIGGRTKRK